MARWSKRRRSRWPSALPRSLPAGSRWRFSLTGGGGGWIWGEPRYQKPLEPLLPDVHLLPFDACDALDGIDERVAGVVVEPIQGEAGVRVPGPDFLPTLRARCREVGALLILDEVQN